jgi:hypothetical protein
MNFSLLRRAGVPGMIACMPRLLLPLFLLAGFSASAEDWTHRTVRVSANEFPIMAWSGSPAGAEGLRLMKEVGLNVTGFCRVEELDKVRDAGLACIVSQTPLEGNRQSNRTVDNNGEGGCKVAIGTSLQRAGMQWTVCGSNAIIALRCPKLSGRFQNLWECR